MGFLRAAEDDRTEFMVVASARGRLTVNGPGGAVNHPKARVFVLEDRTAVIVTPSPEDSTVMVRETVTVDSSTFFPPSRTLTVTASDGAVYTVVGNSCGCGMGSVGNAGPSADRYKLSPVRPPEWHTAG